MYFSYFLLMVTLKVMHFLLDCFTLYAELYQTHVFPILGQTRRHATKQNCILTNFCDLIVGIKMCSCLNLSGDKFSGS